MPMSIHGRNASVHLGRDFPPGGTSPRSHLKKHEWLALTCTLLDAGASLFRFVPILDGTGSRHTGPFSIRVGKPHCAQSEDIAMSPISCVAVVGPSVRTRARAHGLRVAGMVSGSDSAAGRRLLYVFTDAWL